MALEIEHKYLVTSTAYRELSTHHRHIMQGYLSRVPERTVRVRIIDDKAFITVKGKNAGDTRLEFEYEVPLADARCMLTMCEGKILEKTRYYVNYCGYCWEVDEFHADRQGLVVAEIELTASSHDYPLPPFVGEEVTGNSKYYNSNI